jgi:TRAP transporter TAXI family solute receptor
MVGPKLIFPRSALWLYGLAAVLIVSATAAAVIWMSPLPPRVVTMSTGAPGSDYELLAARLQAILKRSGVELRLVPSAGGVENLQRLNDGKSGVSVSFAQGGLTDQDKSPDLVSLGAMFFQPLWFFSRVPAGVHMEGLRGKRISIGLEGSGTRVLGTQVMALSGLGEGFAQLRSLSARQAGEALLHGDIDAAVMVASWDSPVVRQLLGSSDVNVLSFERAEAYVALNPYLTKLRLPAGVGNMAAYRPPTDVELIAPKASLIVRRELHPAIQYLLLEAATEIHSVPHIFQGFERFPSAERGDVPLSKQAQAFYKSGAPFLHRYLPFWLAVFASRILLLLIPLGAIAYPVVNLVPQIYAWSIRRRIFQLYGELRFIEDELKTCSGSLTSELLTRLQRWDERAHRLRVPMNFVPMVYSMRAHSATLRAAHATYRNETVHPG